ncbi:hypothetical protein COL27_32660, partial [Bacillus sp. AFS075960]
MCATFATITGVLPRRPRRMRGRRVSSSDVLTGKIHGLRSSFRTLCRHAIPHLRQIRAQTARAVARF